MTQIEHRQWTDETLAKQFTPILGSSPIWRLRWYLDYGDHKPSVWGPWNRGSQVPSEMAAFKDKSNLRVAIIQGEKIGAWAIQNIVSVDGHRFAGFQWVFGVSIGGGGLRATITQKLTPIVLGMTLLTGEEIATVTVSGQVDVKKLTEKQKKFKFMSEHSRGV